MRRETYRALGGHDGRCARSTTSWRRGGEYGAATRSKPRRMSGPGDRPGRRRRRGRPALPARADRPDPRGRRPGRRAPPPMPGLGRLPPVPTTSSPCCACAPRHRLVGDRPCTGRHRRWRPSARHGDAPPPRRPPAARRAPPPRGRAEGRRRWGRRPPARLAVRRFAPLRRRRCSRHRALAPVFVTPMAAVAGAVADHVLAAMTAGRRLDRAYVNDGGDAALWLAPGTEHHRRRRPGPRRPHPRHRRQPGARHRHLGLARPQPLARHRRRRHRARPHRRRGRRRRDADRQRRRPARPPGHPRAARPATLAPRQRPRRPPGHRRGRPALARGDRPRPRRRPRRRRGHARATA